MLKVNNTTYKGSCDVNKRLWATLPGLEGDKLMYRTEFKVKIMANPGEFERGQIVQVELELLPEYGTIAMCVDGERLERSVDNQQVTFYELVTEKYV